MEWLWENLGFSIFPLVKAVISRGLPLLLYYIILSLNPIGFPSNDGNIL
jgi:hypothetical protein